jgi:hypothetical protein
MLVGARQELEEPAVDGHANIVRLRAGSTSGPLRMSLASAGSTLGKR